jgi:zinc transporter, ZIP family
MGFSLGGISIRIADKIIPHLHVNYPLDSEMEGPKTNLQRSILLVIAITIHNIPEGMAVAMPLRRGGLSRLKSFWYGQLSAVVEPVAGVMGAAFVFVAQPFLPYALSFAVGAMIFVVVEEVIPESQRGGNGDLATLCLLFGFVIMMILDVALA